MITKKIILLCFWIFASLQQKKDNFSIAFIQLHNFIRPLYLAYSYEEAKGSQHKVLASALKDTSFHLNNTVWRVRHEVSYLQPYLFPFETAFYWFFLASKITFCNPLRTSCSCKDSILFQEGLSCYDTITLRNRKSTAFSCLRAVK